MSGLRQCWSQPLVFQALVRGWTQAVVLGEETSDEVADFGKDILEAILIEVEVALGDSMADLWKMMEQGFSQSFSFPPFRFLSPLLSLSLSLSPLDISFSIYSVSISLFLYIHISPLPLLWRKKTWNDFA